MTNTHVITMKSHYSINYFVTKKLVSVEFCYTYTMIFERKDPYKPYQIFTLHNGFVKFDIC